MLENRIDQTQRTWDADHPVMSRYNRQDSLMLAALYEGEHFELVTAWLDFLTNPTCDSKEELFQEAADVVLFLTQMIHCLGSTLEEVCLDKRAYNTVRYAAANFQEGDYHEARAKSRQWVKENDWKKRHYEIGQLAS